MLVIVLIIILILLILQNFLYKNNNLFENLDNQTNTEQNTEQNKPCDHNSNPLFLALKNAANISALQSKISEFSNLKERLDTVENHVKANTKGLIGITHQFSQVGKIHVKKS